MNTSAVVTALLAAADAISGEPSVKSVLEGLLERTGKTEDILAALAEIYDDKKGTEQYKDVVEQMTNTADILRAASDSVAQQWES